MEEKKRKDLQGLAVKHKKAMGSIEAKHQSSIRAENKRWVAAVNRVYVAYGRKKR